MFYEQLAISKHTRIYCKLEKVLRKNWDGNDCGSYQRPAITQLTDTNQ